MDKDLKSAAFTDAALGKVQMATFSVGDKVQAEDVIGPIDAPMFVKAFFSSFWKSARSWFC